MTENREYKGDWFLPSAPENRVSGILTYDCFEGSTLELFGNFSHEVLAIMESEPIMLGLTNESKEITLYKVHPLQPGRANLVKRGETGMPHSFYSVLFILEGVHAEHPDQLKFDHIKAEISDLDEWVGISGFSPIKFDMDKIFREKSLTEIDIHYQLPLSIHFPISENLNGQFSFSSSTPGLTGYTKEVRIEQKLLLILTSTTAFPMDELLEYLIGFQNFLILALYRKTFPTNITLSSPNFQEDFFNEGKLERLPVQLYFAITQRDKFSKTKNATNFLFHYAAIKDEFPTIISNWFARYESLKPAFDLLFEHFYNNERFSENTFLNLAQAAETFHARTDNHTRMPKADYDKMKREILAITPAVYHDWLNEQFNFGNNLNLHKRLSELVDKYGTSVLHKMIGDKESFIQEVKWSRNYYTHYSASSQKKALKGSALFYLTEKLKVLLVSALLIEVGFPKEKLERLLENNKYRFFRYLADW